MTLWIFLDNIIVWAPCILHSKGLGMRNLQYEIRICQKRQFMYGSNFYGSDVIYEHETFYHQIQILKTAIIFGLKLAFAYIVIGFFHHGTIQILRQHNCGLFLTHQYVNVNTVKNTSLMYFWIHHWTSAKLTIFQTHPNSPFADVIYGWSLNNKPYY